MINRFWMLLRREMWENRIGFVWAPLVLSAIIIVMMFMGLFMVYQVDSDHITTSDALRMFAENTPEDKADAMRLGLLGIQVLFSSVMFFVIVFYLLGALYDDRKDRSILFWKSLPLSDTMTVASKLAAGALFIPAIFLLATAVTQVIALIIVSGYALNAGIGLWENLWAPANLLATWIFYILANLMQALWLLPVWGWLLLCSAFAPRLPLLFAIGIPLVIGWIQSYINIVQSFDFKSRTLLHFFGDRLSEGLIPMSMRAQFGNDTFMIGVVDGKEPQLQEQAYTLHYLWTRLLDIDLWLGLVIGAALLAAAVVIRRRATDQ
ncbi:MAG: hypothetical protein Tsb002_21880 [Wenzhouxiangellaceae bacterium]